MTDDPEPMRSLRMRVRAALAAGLLPLGRISSVVRRASGRPCFVCGETIPPSELEHEVPVGEAGRAAVVVHEPCYRLWRVETMAHIDQTAR
jgi:hypothetical protein